MSYCVNCGVELENTQKRCPLCDVEVINPKIAQQQQADKIAYPKTIDVLQKKDRIFWFKFISILLAVPIITCVICNWLVNKQLSWSIYVVSGIFMLWALSTSPLYFKKFNYKKMMLIDMAAIIIGLFLIEFQAPGKGWVFYISLPIVLFCFLSWMTIIYLTKRKILNGLGIAAVFCVSVAAMMVLLETLLDAYTATTVTLFWSWFIFAPCLSIAVLLLLLDKNKHFKHELSKRLHF